ncbi:MAG: LPXTG cell wall anchor domain-containing protein [Ramlibacter sp.]|nr:LPXTG cell wall anchor domain-containing protein [Cryobacterium sp.]
MVCDITITNNYDLDANTTSSTVTTTECHGFAGVPPVAPCATLTESYPQLTTSATQCNGSGNDGGANVICNVAIVNNITGSFTATAATVNQCVGSGTGGGTQPTVDCDPLQNTNLSTATIVQCNGSGNGGGGTDRVNCTVGASTETAALTVKVNQCVGSGGGGGATVDCSTRLTNNVFPAAVVSTATPTPTASPMVAPLVEAAPQLAATGFDSGPLLLSTASALLLGGLVVLFVFRRKIRRPGRQD